MDNRPRKPDDACVAFRTIDVEAETPRQFLSQATRMLSEQVVSDLYDSIGENITHGTIPARAEKVFTAVSCSRVAEESLSGLFAYLSPRERETVGRTILARARDDAMHRHDNAPDAPDSGREQTRILKADGREATIGEYIEDLYSDR